MWQIKKKVRKKSYNTGFHKTALEGSGKTNIIIVHCFIQSPDEGVNC
jgi:hypothetical protein